MRWVSSRLRAVVATTRSRSATASPTASKTLALSNTTSAPDAARSALALGQPSRGLTRRRLDRPQFSMARAAMPILSPSCGRTRITTGAAVAVARPLEARPMPPYISVAGSAPRHSGSITRRECDPLEAGGEREQRADARRDDNQRGQQEVEAHAGAPGVSGATAAHTAPGGA